MDDETFKKELLSRLDQIVELLSTSLPEACLEEPEMDTTTRKVDGPGEPTSAVSKSHYLIEDEMQENYDFAIQRWKQERGNR